MDMELLEGSEFEHLMLDDSGSYPRLEHGEVVESETETKIEKQKTAN